MRPDEFETLIIGGGLAGLTTAHFLLKGGHTPERLALIDSRNPRRGSSSPCGMLHAFPGRSLHPDETTFDKLRTALQFVRHLDNDIADDDTDIAFESPMVRPIRANEHGRQLRNSWRDARSEYPDWFQDTWLDPDELHHQHPAIHADLGAIRYKPAMTVAIDRARRTLHASLRNAGASVRPETTATHVGRSDERDTWTVALEPASDDGDPSRHEAKRVIWACGNALDTWFDLPAGPRAGELLIAEPAPDAPPLRALVSAGGYVAPTPGSPATPQAPRRWIAGATWFDPEELDARDDDTAIEQIRQKTARSIPAIEHATISRIWRGVRFMLGHIAGPLVGCIPDIPHAYVAGAFGSKGLLRIPWAAEQLADLILHSTAPHDTIQPNRLATRWWTPQPPLKP